MQYHEEELLRRIAHMSTSELVAIRDEEDARWFERTFTSGRHHASAEQEVDDAWHQLVTDAIDAELRRREIRSRLNTRFPDTRPHNDRDDASIDIASPAGDLDALPATKAVSEADSSEANDSFNRACGTEHLPRADASDAGPAHTAQKRDAPSASQSEEAVGQRTEANANKVDPSLDGKERRRAPRYKKERQCARVRFRKMKKEKDAEFFTNGGEVLPMKGNAVADAIAKRIEKEFGRRPSLKQIKRWIGLAR